MPDPLRYIIVGLGTQGAQWCRLWLPRLQASGVAIPVAAADTNPERLRHAAEGLGLPQENLFADPIEALEKRRADFAIICVPPMQHEKLIEMALTFDLHVLCESPMADSFDACARIYRKIKAGKKKFAVAMTHRYEEDVAGMAMLLRKNAYGRVNYMVSRFSHALKKLLAWGRYRHEMQDPLLLEEGVHYLDLFRMLNDCNAKYIFAAGWNPSFGPYRGDTSALVTMEMENGVHCLFEGSVTAGSASYMGPNHYLRAECEHGTLELAQRQLRLITGGTIDAPREEALYPATQGQSWGNVLLVEKFCQWLKGGEEMATNVSDQMRLCAMLFAAIESSHTGKQIQFENYLKERMASTRKMPVRSSHADDPNWKSLDD